MTAKIQRHGRAAAIRSLLLDVPGGATAEQLLAAGIDCSLKQLNNSLGAMLDSDQVRSCTTGGNKVWFLTTAMRKLMRDAEILTAPRLARTAPMERSTSTGSNNSTTVLHKDKERHDLAELLAAFRKRGGKIEVLGNSEIRPSLTRRQLNEAGGDARNGRVKCEKAPPMRPTLATVTPPANLRTRLPA